LKDRLLRLVTQPEAQWVDIRDVLVLLGRESGQVTEASLAQADAEAFARIVEPHLPRLMHLAERLGGTAYRDDIVQDALLSAWTKRDRFDPRRGAVSSWLLAIVANQARKSWRRRTISQQRDVAETDPEDEQRLDIEDALRHLSPRQRLAVDCYYFVGLSVPETAVVMGCSEGTVKSTLSDARLKLRPRLEVRP
jgi:RNA polymerase sigma-70 factor (ECF subfamily)